MRPRSHVWEMAKLGFEPGFSVTKGPCCFVIITFTLYQFESGQLLPTLMKDWEDMSCNFLFTNEEVEVQEVKWPPPPQPMQVFPSESGAKSRLVWSSNLVSQRTPPVLPKVRYGESGCLEML